MNIYALNGIRDRDPSQQNAADISLRSQGCRDQQRQNRQNNKYTELVGLFSRAFDLYSEAYFSNLSENVGCFYRGFLCCVQFPTGKF
jgi:hypothetical protein